MVHTKTHVKPTINRESIYTKRTFDARTPSCLCLAICCFRSFPCFTIFASSFSGWLHVAPHWKEIKCTPRGRFLSVTGNVQSLSGKEHLPIKKLTNLCGIPQKNKFELFLFIKSENLIETSVIGFLTQAVASFLGMRMLQTAPDIWPTPCAHHAKKIEPKISYHKKQNDLCCIPRFGSNSKGCWKILNDFIKAGTGDGNITCASTFGMNILY